MEDFIWITIPKKLKEFRLRFNVYDTDQKGTVKVSELLAILRDMGMTISRSQIDEMMMNIDLAGRDEVHFDEFLTMAARKEVCEDSTTELKDAFKVFDNGKGFISVTNLRTIMLNMGDRMSDEEVDEMIQEARVKDGLIQINEFIAVLCR